MKGPVPTGSLIATAGFEAIGVAVDALRMYVLPRIVKRLVYCGVAKCRVTVSPETVGAADCAGTPLTFALAVFISIEKVAATSAGPKAEPSLNFTFFRIVTCRSLPPFWKL